MKASSLEIYIFPQLHMQEEYNTYIRNAILAVALQKNMQDQQGKETLHSCPNIILLMNYYHSKPSACCTVAVIYRMAGNFLGC
jgi:predicted GTPase